MAIRKKNIVEKRNVLNAMKTKMTLQELRVFSVYLSQINARDPETRHVRFPLNELLEILEYKGKISIPYFKSVTDGLLTKLISVPTERGGYRSFQLFKSCTVDQDDHGTWFVELDAHDEALPMLFNFKKEYFTYELRYVLPLTSANCFRLYEILKQYESLGYFEVEVFELRQRMGLENEYSAWSDFRKRVLLPAQKAIGQMTDICFDFFLGQKGARGLVKAIVFHITKNPNIPRVSQKASLVKAVEPGDMQSWEYPEDVAVYAELCGYRFSPAELRVLADIIIKCIPEVSQDADIRRCDLFNEKYHELERASQTKQITNEFGYFRAILQSESEK